MAFKITLWALGVLAIATIYNGVSAYNALGDSNIQAQFEQIGLLDDGAQNVPAPPRKPLRTEELASR
ncbi:MAG: hypothetical protein DI551_07845 [Micavibrio aeruginosavorus]|uniref:Uncharacterized protein n=1 Tax=Micavibrio aeruginosavorus TaxID=349221 RepID=A0A2W5MWV9_9BACT|nr:MAG: hypothetical protein DI551_07845 [Micavibrio aeruginosavorus]